MTCLIEYAFAKPNNSWWLWLDLNQRPKAYESSALPLSYTAITALAYCNNNCLVAGVGFEPTTFGL